MEHFARRSFLLLALIFLVYLTRLKLTAASNNDDARRCSQSNKLTCISRNDDGDDCFLNAYSPFSCHRDPSTCNYVLKWSLDDNKYLDVTLKFKSKQKDLIEAKWSGLAFSKPNDNSQIFLVNLNSAQNQFDYLAG